jgi:DNA-binding response OmpR family regulator
VDLARRSVTRQGQPRKKIEADASRPRHLLTEAGVGYRFVL